MHHVPVSCVLFCTLPTRQSCLGRGGSYDGYTPPLRLTDLLKVIQEFPLDLRIHCLKGSLRTPCRVIAGLGS